MFTHSAIGDNTAENREWLKKIGYEKGDGSKYYPYLLSYKVNAFYDFVSPENEIALHEFARHSKHIVCINNDKLFQAVTALRDDSDYMQWFTDGNIWIQSNNKDFRFDTSIPSDIIKSVNKATIEELIEHFKKGV
jgi:hypothetical protein